MFLNSSGTSNRNHRRQFSSATRGDVTRNENGQNREQRPKSVVSPIPRHQKVIRVQQTAETNGNVRNTPGHQRTQQTAEQRARRSDQRALPKENRGNVDSPVTH